MCVKYGTKYGADYVNKLYNGVKRNLSINHSFACFTEDKNGLDENIKVIPLKEKNSEWQGWWSKVNIFDGEYYRDIIGNEQELTVLYIDLDMIIAGNMDDLVLNFRGRFTTLTTNDIFCEQAQDGYNSSIMIFKIH